MVVEDVYWPWLPQRVRQSIKERAKKYKTRSMNSNQVDLQRRPMNVILFSGSWIYHKQKEHKKFRKRKYANTKKNDNYKV